MGKMSLILKKSLIFLIISILPYIIKPDNVEDYSKLKYFKKRSVDVRIVCQNNTPWFRSKPFIIEGFYESQDEAVSIYWKLVTESEEPVKIDFELNIENGKAIIPPYSLPLGVYKLLPFVKKESWPVEREYDHPCFVYLIGDPPLAIIAGGAKRMVPASYPITLDGSQSKDLSVPEGTPPELKFSWSCQQVLKRVEFCGIDQMSDQSIFTIPAEYVVIKETFEITLLVSDRDGFRSNTSQTVTVESQTVEIGISCEKNCPPNSPHSTHNMLTLLYGRCKKHCKGVKDENFQWTLKSSDGIITDESKFDFGLKGPKLSIKANALQPGRYEAMLKLINTAIEASLILNYAHPPRKINCKIEPPTGHAGVTKFQLKCDHKLNDSDRHLFEIFQENENGQLFASASNPVIDDITFYLAAHVSYIVKITGPNQASITMPLQVTVNAMGSNAKTGDEFKSYIKNIYDRGEDRESVDEMMKGSHKEQVLQLLQIVINEAIFSTIADEEMKGVINELKDMVVEDMLNMPMTDLKHIVQGSNVMGGLMSLHPSNQTDTSLARFATTLCRKMADKHLEMVKGQRYPMNIAAKSASIAKGLGKCLNANTAPNHEIIAPKKFDYLDDRTTLLPTVNEALLEENYPDYVEYDANHIDILRDLDESTINMIKSSLTIAKTLALSTAIGEEVVTDMANNSNVVIAKDFGIALAKAKIKSHGVTVKPSQDFASYYNHSFEILLSTWNVDILWWNKEKLKINTDIISLEFWHCACKERVRNFTKPVDLYFNIKNRSDVVIETDTINVPADYAQKKLQELHEFIVVRRIDLRKNEGVFVQFYNLKATIEAAMVVMKFPTVEDFVHNYTISESSNSSTIYYMNEKDYDIWCYLAVLLKRSSNNILNFTYGVSFTKYICLKWIVAVRAWTIHCAAGPESTGEVIHCQCNSLSVIAGQLENIETLPQKLQVTKTDLKLQYNYIVLVWVVILFLVYFIFMIFGACRRPRPIYFLADNHQNDLYAYLLIIKTGLSWSAGTSSNVMIQLFGEKKASESHLLNYPDPDMKMLQSYGEDWFLLTCHSHLGDLTKISLWFDSSGARPSWYCKEILIQDLQTKQKWVFRVEKYFRISKLQTETSATLLQEDTVKERRFFRDCNVFNNLHTWYLSDDKTNLSYLKRITLILSTILTANCIALFMYGLPTFTLLDCIDPFGHFIVGYDLISITIISSVLSSSMHIIIAHILRYSRNQFTSIYELEDLMFSFSVTRNCWFFLITLICISTTILVIYGFWLPYISCLMWLTSAICSVLLDVFVYQIFAALICRSDRIEEVHLKKSFVRILVEIEHQRKFLYEKFGPNLFRAYFKHLYTPLRRNKIRRKKRLSESRRKILEQIQDIIMIGIYVIILYLVILEEKDPLTVYSYETMKSMVEGEFTNSLGFSEITELLDLKMYLDVTLIHILDASEWYPGFSYPDPGLMVDFTNKFMGVARIRQLRVIDHSCEIPELMHYLNDSCDPQFSFEYEETRDFSRYWKPRSADDLEDRLSDIWKYSPKENDDSPVTLGHIALYSGGGYICPLGRTFANSYINLRVLLETWWMNDLTRAVFIEFLTYNANYNIFNAVTLMFEMSASGYSIATTQIQTTRMLFVKNQMFVMSVVVSALFVVWVGILLVNKTIGVVLNYRTFFKDIWFLIDLFMLVMSVCCIILYAVRIRMIGEYLDQLEQARHNEFINYFNLFALERVLTVFAAVLVCVATIRLWKLLRFGKVFRLMERTLIISFEPLIGASVFAFILMLSFGIVGMLYLGESDKNFSSPLETITSLMLLSLSLFDTIDMAHFRDHLFGRVFFTAFSILMLITNFIFITGIGMSYVKAQDYMSKVEESEKYNIKDYLKDQGRFFPSYIRSRFFRLRAGQDTEKKKFVKPKATEFRYANCFLTKKSTLTFMKYITASLLKNLTQTGEQQDTLTDQQLSLMFHISSLVVGRKTVRDDKEIFFKAHFSGEQPKLIYEKRIEKASEIVEMLLHPPDERDFKVIRNKEVEECVKTARKSMRTVKMIDLRLEALLFKLDKISVDID